MNFKLGSFILLVISLLWSCSTNKHTILGDFFHNTSAHYNGYFYAKEKTLEVENKIINSLDDNPAHILRLFTKLDSTLAKSYVSDTEEIIKMASVSIQFHPQSRWLYDNYRLVGLARLFNCDYLNAIQTFKYVNKNSGDHNLRHQAINDLIRAYIEFEDLERAEEAIKYLEKETLSSKNAKDLFLLKAYFYQITDNYPQMLNCLTQATPMLRRIDRKGRIYFIIGQLNQKLGYDKSADEYYRKCLRTNPTYEMDFYARLNLTQVSEVSTEKARITIRKKFSKLLKDSKNLEYKDQIYYDYGLFEKKLNNLDYAIELFTLSAHSGEDSQIKGNAYIKIGELYFDSLKQFHKAKLYYDSTLSFIQADYPNYENILTRQKMLVDFVTYSETIQWSDSLLSMAKWDSTKFRSHIDSAVRARQILEIKNKKKQYDARKSQRRDNNPIYTNQSTGTQDWYFGNPVAIEIGQSDFKQIWGDIQLADNWRISKKGLSIPIGDESTANENEPTINNEIATTEGEIQLPDGSKDSELDEEAKLNQLIEKEYNKIYAQLPKTDLKKNILKDQIAEAYLNLGDLYNFRFLDLENALSSYQILLERFPNSILVSEALYKIYLIYKESNDPLLEISKQRLLTEYPQSTYSKLILNPNYLEEYRNAEKKQKQIYTKAYKYYEVNDLLQAQKEIELAKEIGKTSFSPSLELLQILITGKTEDISQYQTDLSDFIDNYPEDSLSSHAEYLLKSSKTFIEKKNLSKGIRYEASFDTTHIFVIIHPFENNSTKSLINTIEDYNTNFYKKLNLQTTSLTFNDSLTITFSKFIPNKKVALEYLDSFNVEVARIPPLSELFFYKFVITNKNFNTLYRYKILDEYLTFFNRHYQKDSP